MFFKTFLHRKIHFVWHLIVQTVVQPHFALEAAEPVSEPVPQMAAELINNHIAKEMGVKATFFFM